MNTTTFVRNGIIITMPMKRKPQEPIQKKVIEKSVVRHVMYSKIRVVEKRKKCMRCGADSWRSDVQYCWDCYKYEKFESR